MSRSQNAASDGQLQGKELLLSMYSLLRNAAIHEIHNRALDIPAGQLRQALRPFLRGTGQTVTAVAMDGQFFLNDSKIVVPSNQYFLLRDLTEILDRRDVGGITFLELPSVSDLKAFANLFAHAPANSEGMRSGLVEAIEEAAIGSIQVAPPMRLRLDGEQRLHGEALPGEVDATLAYAKALAIVAQELETPGPRGLGGTHVRRVIQELVDGLDETRDYLVGMTQWLKDEAGPALVATNTGLIAMAVALSLRVPRALISDIGLAAFSTVEWRQDRGAFNPMRALKHLTRHQMWSHGLIRRVMTVLHQPEADDDFTSTHRYPLAQIYRVSHDFIALTHGYAPIGAEAAQPTSALNALLAMAKAHDRYDNIVLKQLVDVVGLYPLGTLLVLRDQGDAFVVGRLKPDVPIVRIRLPRGQFSSPFVLADHANEATAVKESVEPSQRAAAVLGPKVRDMIGRMSENLANRDELASVAVRRMKARLNG